MGTRTKKKSPAIDTTVTSTPVDAIAPEAPRIPGTNEGFGILIGKRELASAIGAFAAIVDRKSTMPMLANVSLRVDHVGMTIVGTDLDVSLRMRVECRVARPGSVSVPHKRLADLLKTLPDGDVTLYQTSKTNLVVVAGGSEATIDGISDRDAPAFPKLGKDFAEYESSAWPSLDGSVLRALLDRVQHAVCKDETRFHLNGTLFQSDGVTARAVTTDGHRLVKASAVIGPAPTPGSVGGTPMAKDALLRRKLCAAIVKLVSKTSGTACEMLVTKTHAWIRQGNFTLVGKLIDAQFPPYEQVIPKDNQRLFTVDRKALESTLQRAKLVCKETRGIEMRLATGKLTIETSDPDAGKTTEALAVDYTGDDMAMGANPVYLLEAIKEIDDANVVFAWSKSPLDPMLVRSLDDAAMRAVADASLLAVVMPMRI